MVKGISRQVIVVHAPEPKLFEQAIFILKEDAVSEGILMKEAEQAIRDPQGDERKHPYLYGMFWAGSGAAVMGLLWLLTLLF